MNEFEEYIRQGDPNQCERAAHWQIAIGLQDVDRLKPSKYLVQTAQEHIEEKITMDEVEQRINAYYKTQQGRMEDDGTNEADIVSARIVGLLAEDAFTFAPTMLTTIHRKLFNGVLLHAGQYRTYNISKKEWVLDNASVLYASADMIGSTLDYDFSQERNFSYVNMSPIEAIQHIASFISDIWQIHPFGEGNTRTTAVFAIKYLIFLGYNVSNTAFQEHSWYFRNALVRANYRNVSLGIERNGEFLELFFRNLLWGEHNELRNRYTHIRWNGERPHSIEPNSTGDNFGRNLVTSVQNSKTSVQIIQMMREMPFITAAVIAQELGRSKRAIEMQIAKLVKEGKIIHQGANKGGHWEVL